MVIEAGLFVPENQMVNLQNYSSPDYCRLV
jgi:hypothetical protein